MKRQLLFLALVAIVGGCSAAPRPVARENQTPIRAAALHFTQALRAADGDSLHALTTHETDPDVVALSQKVIADAIKARQIQQTLQRHFGEAETRAGVSGTDAWIEQFAKTAATEPILQAGNRVRVGEAGTPGTFFLRHVGGNWKVEAVPTLVAETGGRAKMEGPLLHYRLGVTLAVNAWMLARLDRGEFTTMHDYMAAKSQFWFEFMAFAANGDDPRDKLLPSLPPLPAETTLFADDR